MKLTNKEIAILIGMFMVIITLNAWYRVKAMGASEQQRESREAAERLDAGLD